MTSLSLHDDEPVSACSILSMRSDSQSTKSTNPSSSDASDTKSDYEISSQGSHKSSSKGYNYSHASSGAVSPFNLTTHN